MSHESANPHPFQLFPEMVSSDFTNENPTNHYLYSGRVDRTMAEYSEAFGFDLSVLAGSRVLDLGAGYHALFAHEAKQKDIDVVAVNPAWVSDQYVDKEHAPDYWRSGGQRAIAQAQQLPFQTESFDYVLSLWGVPAYLPGNWEAYHRTFSEIHRVMRIGGLALLYPVPAMTVKQPAFREVLESAVGTDYKILEKGVPPKLLLTKGAPKDTSLLDGVLRDADRMTQPFLF